MDQDHWGIASESGEGEATSSGAVGKHRCLSRNVWANQTTLNGNWYLAWWWRITSEAMIQGALITWSGQKKHAVPC